MASVKMDTRTAARFKSDPNRFIEEVIRKFVRTSPFNRLAAFNNAPIFEAPLVGFADADDPIFMEYKKVVHPEHFSPREILRKHLSESAHDLSEPADVSVISFALPINRETLTSNAKEKEGPSLRWNNTRWQGQDFITELSRHLVSLLESLDIKAVAPDLTPFFKIDRLADTIASNWSQRHMAYAAGLGTFSLNEGFITSKGQAMRCGSIVLGLKLKPTQRIYANHLANCLFFATGKCGVCIRRCPRPCDHGKGARQAEMLGCTFQGPEAMD